MRVIAKKVIRDFWKVHEDSEEKLLAWYQEASKAIWRNHNELKKEYPSASILNDSRIVFNIKGNYYRLVVKINYHYQMIWIRFVGTHAEYDKLMQIKFNNNGNKTNKIRKGLQYGSQAT